MRKLTTKPRFVGWHQGLNRLAGNARRNAKHGERSLHPRRRGSEPRHRGRHGTVPADDLKPFAGRPFMNTEKLGPHASAEEFEPRPAEPARIQ